MIVQICKIGIRVGLTKDEAFVLYIFKVATNEFLTSKQVTSCWIKSITSIMSNEQKAER